MMKRFYLIEKSGLPSSKIFGMLLALTLTPISAFTQKNGESEMINQSHPVIIPVPDKVNGKDAGVISMSGLWLTKNDTTGFLNDPSLTVGWSEVMIPQERDRRGVPGSNLTVYKKKVLIPDSFKVKRAIIRFDGVAHKAKLYVNGSLVREHWGSFMPWTCDITDKVLPGKEAWITLFVDQSRFGLSAFMRSGGIQRDVSMYAIPTDYINYIQVLTDLDKDYKNAMLKLKIGITFTRNSKVKVIFTLKDKQGKIVALKPGSLEIAAENPEAGIVIPVKNPEKWDAEHPELYELEVSIIEGKEIKETVTQKIGFRKVEMVGRLLLINGKEVKFRGMWGGSSARVLRDLNVNHTRQLWATEAFLDSCDKLGVYVLDENPVDFAKNGVESDPAFTYQWVNMTSELMVRDFNHPSVIMWGIANESSQGENILKVFKYIRANDPDRPVMHSWANRVRPEDELPYDIYSFHYPDITKKVNELADYGVATWHSSSLIIERKPLPVMPVIHDEYAHTALSPEEIKRDPNVRNFWGESIKRFWEKMFTTTGALGGDQFGIFSDLDKGMPEPWLMRKAYSPVRIEKQILENPGSGSKMRIPVRNWFDHTSLDELKILWQVGRESGQMSGPKILPHSDGIIELPARKWNDGDTLRLRFLRKDGLQVDEYNLAVNPASFTLPELSGPAPEIVKNNKEIIVKGKGFELVFDKYKGQIISGKAGNKLIITGGPHLQFERSGIDPAEYKCQGITTRMDQNVAVVLIDAIYSPISAVFELRIDGNGLIKANYIIKDFPDAAPAVKTIPWNQTDIGGYSEIGLYFELSNDIDRIEWSRKSLWTVYPSDHIGRASGVAYRNLKYAHPNKWSEGTRDWQFTGVEIVANAPATNDFRASKEYIRYVCARLKNTNAGLKAISPEKDAVRMLVMNNVIRMVINNEWNYPTLGLGNYMKDPIKIKPGYSNSVMVQIIND